MIVEKLILFMMVVVVVLVVILIRIDSVWVNFLRKWLRIKIRIRMLIERRRFLSELYLGLVLLFIFLLLVIFFIFVGISERLIKVIMVFVMIGGNNMVSLLKKCVNRKINNFVVIIEL